MKSPIARLSAVTRVFKIAKRVGATDVAGPSGLSSRALQQARLLAMDANALRDDVDDATIAGLEAGRGGWSCNLLEVPGPEVGAVKQGEK